MEWANKTLQASNRQKQDSKSGPLD